MAGIGCEPRLDYSLCESAAQEACFSFYVVTLAFQTAVCLAANASLVPLLREKLSRACAPHAYRPWWLRLWHARRRLAKDTVLQMQLGVGLYSAAAVFHRGSMLRPSPWLPLLVEYAFNFYNILLIATIATTLRFWMDFMLHAGGGQPTASAPDRLLARAFSWQGCVAFVSGACCFCFLTDTWALLSRDRGKWEAAVALQQFVFTAVCFFIALGSLRFGLLQEGYMKWLLRRQSELLREDKAIWRQLRSYRLLFRASFLGNSLVWLSCFMACCAGSTLARYVYAHAHGLLLLSYFNFAGVLFGCIVVLLSHPRMREAELRFHDLLAYTAVAEAGEPGCFSQQLSLGEAAMKRRAAEGVLKGAAGYPCFVMSLGELVRYDRLPRHEDALAHGSLEVLTESSYWPCRSYVHFVSQTWIDECHPDGEPSRGSPKLKWLKELGPEALAKGKSLHDVFVWMDIFSIPQLSREYMSMGIASLPRYVQLAGNFVPLVQNEESVEGYCRRGWCMLECICALTPKLNQSLQWRLGPHPHALQFHFYDNRPEEQHLVSLEMLRDPCDQAETDFTNEEDREVIRPVLESCAQTMSVYEQSASTSWDHTFNVRLRPDFLKVCSAIDTSQQTCTLPLYFS